MLALLLGLFAAYLLFTGPRNLDRYPHWPQSSYKLPWPAGVTWFCAQGNRGVVSHRGREEFAYDFSMPVGSDVCAARGGVVKAVKVIHDGAGLHAPNNYVSIDHGDSTVGWYIHLKKGGSLVQPGERVVQGQKIALSGHVGRSLAPHLHFQVTRSNTTVPVSFADVPENRGVPRMGFRYISANTSPQ